MSFFDTNSSTVSSYGTTGSFSSYATRDQKRAVGVSNANGSQIGVYGYLTLCGPDKDKNLDLYTQNTGLDITWAQSVMSTEDDNIFLFKNSDGTYVQGNFNNATYTQYSEDQLLSTMGITSDNRPDIVTLNQGGFSFYEFINSGLEDGVQDSITTSGYFENMPWGKTTMTIAELDTSYWGSDDESYEAYKSNQYFDLIKGNASQFMTNSEINYASTLTSYTTFATLLANLVEDRLF